MAPRPYWKGYLKVALVNCPVTLSPVASDASKIRFHTINRATGNRVETRYIDAETGKPVDPEDEVKGYEIGEDKFVKLEDKELDAVALESTRTIDVEIFVPRASIGWIWLDQPHYLAPGGKIGEEAFAVIREATKTVGCTAPAP
jgi:DNA end-binding protein Ku